MKAPATNMLLPAETLKQILTLNLKKIYRYKTRGKNFETLVNRGEI